MSAKKRRNSIGQQFIAHRRDMREAPAWRHLPDNARRILDRLELEHMRHGSAENGRLPCTYADFEKAGIRRKSVALAIRQCVALGFLEVTRQGRRSVAEFRTPSLYRLTYVHGRGRSEAPTDEWQRISTDEHALAVLAALKAAPIRDLESRGNNAPRTVGAKSPPAQARHKGH